MLASYSREPRWGSQSAGVVCFSPVAMVLAKSNVVSCQCAQWHPSRKPHSWLLSPISNTSTKILFFFSASKHTFGGRTAKYNNQVHVNMIQVKLRHEYGVFESRSHMFQKTGKGKSHYHELLRISNEMTLTTDNKTLIASS